MIAIGGIALGFFGCLGGEASGAYGLGLVSLILGGLVLAGGVGMMLFSAIHRSPEATTRSILSEPTDSESTNDPSEPGD